LGRWDKEQTATARQAKDAKAFARL
jgi:hypothetical protein